MPLVREEHPAVKLIGWLQTVSVEGDDEAPDWADDYLFAAEQARARDIAALERQHAEILEQIEQVRADQEADQQWKRLVFAHGEVLERQVEEAFKLIGFQVLERAAGRSDIRMELSETRLVVEVKGLTKSAAESHVAQLEKWIAEELSYGENAKGVLVANAWRTKAPRERNEAPFPDQMMGYSISRGHCLITGLQRLAMVRRVLAEPASAASVAEQITTTVGVVKGWDSLDEVFAREEISELPEGD